MLTLLHLSDIHFNSPICCTSHDPDAPYRSALLIDAIERAEALGGINAILVGGDIAFKGHKEEYAVATDWLYSLADSCGCARELIYVIPGNHDVDREIIKQNASIRNAQQAIFRAPLGKIREKEFHGQMKDNDTGQALFRPLLAYNEFAAPFACNLYTPDRFFWRHEIPIDDSAMLRIHGLTSTALSGIGAPQGIDDKRGELYLSPFQTAISSEYDVVNLVMCHHPPDWLADSTAVNDALSERAEIHLLHHEHRQRVLLAPSYARFNAGAVNPDRYEAGWRPGYNLITVSANDAHLAIEAHVLEWQENPDRFRPREDRDGAAVFRHSLPIRRRRSLPTRLPCQEDPRDLGTSLDGPLIAERIPASTEQEAAMPDTTAKDLVFRFWNLTSSDRRQICLSLGAINENDFALPEPERYSRALKRIADGGLVGAFAEEVNKRGKS